MPAQEQTADNDSWQPGSVALLMAGLDCVHEGDWQSVLQSALGWIAAYQVLLQVQGLWVAGLCSINHIWLLCVPYCLLRGLRSVVSGIGLLVVPFSRMLGPPSQHFWQRAIQTCISGVQIMLQQQLLTGVEPSKHVPCPIKLLVPFTS